MILRQAVVEHMARVDFFSGLADLGSGVQDIITTYPSAIAVSSEVQARADRLKEELDWNGGGRLFWVRTQRHVPSGQVSALGSVVDIGRGESPLAAYAESFAHDSMIDIPKTGVLNVEDPENDFYIWVTTAPEIGGGSRLVQGIIPKPFAGMVKADAAALRLDTASLHAVQEFRASAAISANANRLRKLAANAETTARVNRIELELKETSSALARIERDLKQAIDDEARASKAAERIGTLKKILSFAALVNEASQMLEDAASVKAISNSKNSDELAASLTDRVITVRGEKMRIQEAIVVTRDRRSEAIRQFRNEILHVAPEAQGLLELFQD